MFQLIKKDISAYNGTVILSWTLQAGANACERPLYFAVFLGDSTETLENVYNTTDTSSEPIY